MSFVVNFTETRNDDADLHGYGVSLVGKDYLLYYDKDQLREVYFNFPGYIFSCRTDMKTISHYYYTGEVDDIRGAVLKRYENGVLNRIYHDNRTTGIAICVIDGVERVYTTVYSDVGVNKTKLYEDLVNFLIEFNSLELYEYFSPKEPVEQANSTI